MGQGPNGRRALGRLVAGESSPRVPAAEGGKVWGGVSAWGFKGAHKAAEGPGEGRRGGGVLGRCRGQWHTPLPPVGPGAGRV